MTKEEIRDIFIEEATDVIEKLDVDIINFEENTEDKSLLNEFFRGVHTLKGSANSFGFTRLGEFVHHFEDVLDHYRNTDDIVTPEQIDLFLSSVDTIKDVMWREVEENENLPENYDEVLEGIKKILAHKTEETSDELPDLASEFSNNEDEIISISEVFDNFNDDDLNRIKTMLNDDDLNRIKTMLNDGEELYYISLKLDDDIYFRGFDHAKIFNLLRDEGRILESWWDMGDVLDISSIDVERCTIKCVDLFIVSYKTST